MNPLTRALVDELRTDPAALRELAEALAPLLAPAPTEDRWLDSAEAAAYLSISRNALHKATAARQIPFVQDGPGCKCWFRRSALDAWRAGGVVPARVNSNGRRP